MNNPKSVIYVLNFILRSGKNESEKESVRKFLCVKEREKVNEMHCIASQCSYFIVDKIFYNSMDVGGLPNHINLMSCN